VSGVPVAAPAQPTKPARPQAVRPPSRPPGVPRDPLEQTRPVDPRILAASTWNMDESDDDLDGIGERTVITEPPGFDSAAATNPVEGLAADGGYEPTMIEQGWSSSSATAVAPEARDEDTADGDNDETGETHTRVDEDEDGPTLPPRARARDDDDDAPTRPPHQRDDDEDGPTMTRNEAVRRTPPPSPAVRVPKSKAPPPPALAASTPTPAVSEVRKPRTSRRTPAGGVPQGGSVLQAMINAAGSEPMPTRVAPGRGGPSDGVPPQAPDPASAMPPSQGVGPAHLQHPGSAPHQQPMYQTQPPPMQPPPMQQPPPLMQQQPPLMQQPPYVPQGYPQSQPPPYGQPYPQQPQQGYPGQHAVPQNMPPHLQPYGWQQQPPYTPTPGAPQGLPPGVANQAGQPYPFQPYPVQPGANAMPTFTQQMRAVIELDEIPSQFKLQQSGPRWFVLVIAAMIAIAGAAVATYFILRRNAEPKLTAVLLIDSVPSGATVTLDGTQLPNPTPVPFSDTAPGKRHNIKITLPGHRVYQEEIVVPPSGGEYRVAPILQRLTGKIAIDTQPGGADIYINGSLRGVTPKVLVDLEIGSVKELELRHKDFGTRTIPLAWPESGEIKLNIDLKKPQ
jgi:hypothetical protein